MKRVDRCSVPDFSLGAERPRSVARRPQSLRSVAVCAGAIALVLGLAACSSGSEAEQERPAALEEGAGGDPSERSDAPAAVPGGESTPGGAAANDEVRDPSLIGNVMPGSAPPEAGTAGAGAPAAAPSEPSAGCGRPGLLSSGAQTIEVDGRERTYILDVPSGYDGTAPLPLVFAFHGATTSGELFRSRFYGDLLSTMSEAALVVHADALGDPTSWDNDADLPFFDAMLAALEEGACVDRARVFATGHSSGGFFTNTLGCERGDVLRAIAPVSAGGPFAFGANACSGEVAVWLAHAENDETVPFDLGVASRDRWLEANGCSEASAAVEPSPCVEYAGCSSGLPVRWCLYEDGHAWPEFGPEGIWSFFSRL